MLAHHAAVNWTVLIVSEKCLFECIGFPPTNMLLSYLTDCFLLSICFFTFTIVCNYCTLNSNTFIWVFIHRNLCCNIFIFFPQFTLFFILRNYKTGLQFLKHSRKLSQLKYYGIVFLLWYHSTFHNENDSNVTL